MKRGKATIRSAFFPAHAGTDSFRAASPFYESLGRRGDASLAGGFGGGREEAFLERFLLIIIKSILRSAQQKGRPNDLLFKFLAGYVDLNHD